MYRLIKPLLFLFDPETAHHLIFGLLKWLNRIPGMGSLIRSIYVIEHKKLNRTLFGLDFPNPVGLAAGLDKDARLFNELACFGFGFIEVGTLTPRPQSGNPKPRLFRLIPDKALINRMGFNNEGVEMAVKRLRNRKAYIIIGGNIGKNKDTPNEDAIKDYEACFHHLFDYVDYFVVNVSSPNTPNLRALQEKEPLTALLKYLVMLNQSKPDPKPLLLKIAPDLSNEQLDDIVEIVNETRIDGVIASNTTISRNGLSMSAEELEHIGPGGLSGEPLKNRSTEVIRYLSMKSGNAFPIIGAGGIHSANDALEKLKAGASLVQVYTGFIYEGPALVKQINKVLLKN